MREAGVAFCSRLYAGRGQSIAQVGAWSIRQLEQESVRWIVTVATPVNVGIGAPYEPGKENRSFPVLRKDKRSADG